MIEFDPSQFIKDKFFMCVNKIYKGEVYSSRNGKVDVRCNQTVNENSIDSITWTVVSSSDKNYQVGDYFSASMGHALPCKNPNGQTESQRQCRLHALDAVKRTSRQSNATDSVRNIRKLVPNAALTDLIVEGVAQAIVKPSKVLSVQIVKDPKVANKINTKPTAAKVITKQGRDRFGRFLTTAKASSSNSFSRQGRDRFGRFLPKK
jgi:uncharacterized protein (DUF1499 family)